MIPCAARARFSSRRRSWRGTSRRACNGPESEGFACERWKDFDGDVWDEVVRDGERVLEHAPPKSWARTRTRAPPGYGGDGIANAGVENDVAMRVADCLEWTPSHKPSLVISNPPWDGRLRAPTRPGRL